MSQLFLKKKIVNEFSVLLLLDFKIKFLITLKSNCLGRKKIMTSHHSITHHNLLSEFLTKYIDFEFRPLASHYVSHIDQSIDKLARRILADLQEEMKELKPRKRKNFFEKKFENYLHSFSESHNVIKEVILDNYELMLSFEKISEDAKSVPHKNILCPTIFSRQKSVYPRHLEVRWAPDNCYLYQEHSLSLSPHFTSNIKEIIETDWQAALNQHHTDIKFLLDDNKELYAHRSILQIRSPYFEALFAHPLKEKQTGEIHITNCSYEVFKKILEFIYKNDIDDLCAKDIKTLIELLPLAHLYQVDSLVALCTDKLNAWLAENKMDEYFNDIFYLGVTYQIRDFMQACLRAMENDKQYLEQLELLINPENLESVIEMAKNTSDNEIRCSLLDKVQSLINKNKE